MKKTVALLYGGAGAEHDVSVLGFRNVIRIFDKEKYRVLPVYIDKGANWYINDKDGGAIPTFPARIGGSSGFINDGGLLSVDCVFPLLHGDMGEDGVIQGLLSAVGIPFVGEGVDVGSLCADKAYCKRIAETLGIPVARYVSLKGGYTPEDAESICAEKLGYPMFIKPAALGSSVGARAVRSREEFLSAYSLAARLGSDNVLAEELITDKRETECAVLVTDAGAIVTHPSEIIIDGTYGYSEKYRRKTETRVFAEVSENVKNCLQEYSHKLIRGIGIRSMSRIDFFITGERVIFNEINTMPGFTEESMYLKMLGGAGISPETCLDMLIERALRAGRA